MVVAVDREFLGRRYLSNSNMLLNVLDRTTFLEGVITRFWTCTWISLRCFSSFRFLRALHLGKVDVSLLCSRWFRPVCLVDFFFDLCVGSTWQGLALLGLLLVLLSFFLHFLTVARVSDVAQVAGVLRGHAQLFLLRAGWNLLRLLRLGREACFRLSGILGISDHGILLLGLLLSFSCLCTVRRLRRALLALVLGFCRQQGLALFASILFEKVVLGFRVELVLRLVHSVLLPLLVR